MAWRTIGTAGRADDSDEIEIRVTAPVPRFYRVLAIDVPAVLEGDAAVLCSEEGLPIGDVASSASGRMLLGASRAGRGFVAAGSTCPVDVMEFLIPRDHLRAHYHRHDGPVEVLGGGGA